MITLTRPSLVKPSSPEKEEDCPRIDRLPGLPDSRFPQAVLYHARDPSPLSAYHTSHAEVPCSLVSSRLRESTGQILKGSDVEVDWGAGNSSTGDNAGGNRMR